MTMGTQYVATRIALYEAQDEITKLQAELDRLRNKVAVLRTARDDARAAYFDGKGPDDDRDLLSGYHLGLSTALLLFVAKDEQDGAA